MTLTCQWLEGEPTDPACGAPTLPGKPYCAAHQARAHIPEPPRRRGVAYYPNPSPLGARAKAHTREDSR